MTYARILVTSLACLGLLAACTTTGPSGTGSGDTTTQTTSLMSSTDVITSLQAQGLTVNASGQTVSEPFFAASGVQIQVDNQPVDVFIYTDAVTAKADADKISDDGMSVSGTAVNWPGPPHFFQTNNLLVLYTGSDPTVIHGLEGAVGIQFAGASDTGSGTTTTNPATSSGATMSY